MEVRKVRKKIILIGFIFIVSILNTINVQLVQAASSEEYTLGATKGTEIILEVKSVNEDRLKEIFGATWEEILIPDAVEVGLKWKIVITELDDSAKFDFQPFDDQKGIGYKVDLWEWTDKDFEVDPDKKDQTIAWFETPGDLNDIYNYYAGFSGQMPFVPNNVLTYLENVNYKHGWEGKGNEIIHRDKVKEAYTMTYTYDESNGFLSKCIIEDSENVIVYEVLISNAIPGYEVSILLSISMIGIVGLVILYYKKQNK